MKKTWKGILSVLLTLLMLLEMSEALVAFAADEVDKALHPTKRIEVTVPSSLEDGGNYFFIREESFAIREKSEDRLYIPIQRTGDTGEAAEVTLKLIDLSARYGVNYEAELYHDATPPVTVMGGIAVIDLFLNADEQYEATPVDEETLGALLTENGGSADLRDAAGEVAGSLSAVPLDENGEPLPLPKPEETDASAAPARTAAPKADAAEDAEPDSAQALMAGRSRFLGENSDRQPLEGGNDFLHRDIAAAVASSEERQLTDEELAEEAYPGREFTVRFEAGETVKFLVISPKYDEAADGDSTLSLLLKGLPEGAVVPENFNMRSVIIQDEDERETVTISMADAVVCASAGKAVVTVERSGGINNLVGVMLSSSDGSAAAGKDYSGVGAKLWFSMGLTSRTVEIPVGHGTEEKDFTLILSPIPGASGVEIGEDTVRVVIPPAEKAEEDVRLQAEDSYGEDWNLRDRMRKATGRVRFDSDTAVFMDTGEDELETQYISLYTREGYAWDGIHVEYDYMTWYSKGIVKVEKTEGAGDGWTRMWYKDWGDCSMMSGQSLDAYYGQTRAPWLVSIDNRTWEVHNGFRDSHSDMWVKSVSPIRRSFTVELLEANELSFEGLSPDYVHKHYTKSQLNDDNDTVCTLLTGDNFSVSRVGLEEYARLRELVAVAEDGRTYRLGTAEGASGTIAAALNPDTIDALAEGGFITWTENKGSYSGRIKVRPVYGYVKDVAVEVKETPYGCLRNGDSELPGGTYTFHFGDKLTFLPNVAPTWADRLWATGVRYVSRRGGSAGVKTGDGIEKYVDDGWSITLDQDWYSFEQLFTDVDNMVTVRVPKEDMRYFDTAQGLFRDLTPTDTGDGYQTYTLRKGLPINEFVELTAVTADYDIRTEAADDGDESDEPGEGEHRTVIRKGELVPVWIIEGDSREFSGDSFCFFAGSEASDNLVTLRVDRNASDHAWYSLRGTAYYSTLNLTTGNEADDMHPAAGVIVTAAGSGTQADEDGRFTLEPGMYLGGSWARYVTVYNGAMNIREVKLAPADAKKETVTQLGAMGEFTELPAVPVSLGEVKVESWSRFGAHFDTVAVKLGGFNPDIITAIEMNGRSLSVDIHVDPGQRYLYNGREYTENVTDVTLWFQSQITGVIHGIYSIHLREGEKTPGLTWDPMTNTASLYIRKFEPNAPDKYTWGDVMMVRLTTDKKVAGNPDGEMVYQPVSTGYAVITDQDYVPETYEENVDIASLMEASLSDDNERYSFGKFPWLGDITAVVTTFSYFVSSGFDDTAQNILNDLELMTDGTGELLGGNVLARRGGVSAAVAFKETPYGGVRTMFAVAFSAGNSTYSNQANPFRAKHTALSFVVGLSDGSSGGLIYNGAEFGNKKVTKYDLARSELGGKYIYFTIFVGIYCDWGFIEHAKTDGSGETEISHEAVFLGAGGFYGIKLNGGYTQYVFPFGIPVYFNIEAQLGVTVFLGSSADPEKTLQSFYETEDHKGQDFAFSMELYAEAGLKLSIGLGLYKIVGLRASGGAGIQAGLSLRMGSWFPGLEGTDTVSFSTDATFSGSIDLVVTSIDLWSASWPLPLGFGWMQFFQQTRRANALIHFINEEIRDLSTAEKRKCREMADALAAYVDAYHGTADELRERIDELNDFAYDEHIISLTQWRRVNMIRQGGIVGNIMDTVTLTGEEEASALFHTRDHVESRWVAGEEASLQAAFGPVSTSKLVENSVSQPAAQIAALGGNEFLVVFLDDDLSRDRQQANVLKWTVYNADTDTWTEPLTVQDDGTADGRPDLIDGGDKLILSWPSVAADKYERLRLEVAREKNVLSYNEEDKVYTVADDTAVTRALEQDPARLLDLTEIYSAEFSKSGRRFGPVTQLTDDFYYDAGPQAVYDSGTGDYIVLYYKTGRDTEYAGDAEDRLLEMVSSNPGTFVNAKGEEVPKTYSVLCYMLFNNQTETPDTRGETHEPGWAWDYYFPNETAESPDAQAESLARMKGQRYFNSVVRGANGEQTDPPIADLSACSGYNGLAAFAFTVDRDFDTETDEDKELYLKFYDFAAHRTYVAVKVAGEAVKTAYSGAVRDENRKTVVPASVYDTTTAVDVGQPKLIRSEGSTWLFWREDNDGLRYLNVSEMLNAKVGSGPAEEDWTWALRDDGSFAADYLTGETYAPHVQKVDFGSALNSGDLSVTDYQVITDAEDNLYVVWTDLYTYEAPDEVFGGTVTNQAQAIYATAKIKETDTLGDEAKETEDGETPFTAAWSRPYALTRDNSHNDGVAVALDDNGGLILVHNQYRMELADTEKELSEMIDRHLAGIWTDGETGRSYFLGYPYYPTDMSLALTRCEAIGSVEATQFEFDDDTPVAGQTVTVTAVVENAGLTSAKGCEIEFYEYRDGVRGQLLSTVRSDDTFQVNTARRTAFLWTIPADGPEGCCIQAVAREKRGDGSWYEPVETFSGEFAVQPVYEPELVECVQNGDSFDVKYTVTNSGNRAVPEGTKADLILEGLYGDLKETYGMDDEVLMSADISGLAPGETRTVSGSVTLPVSVFRFCGYDAVTVAVRDGEDTALAVTNHNFITLDAPLNLKINGGAELSLKAGEQKKAELSFESTVFMDVSGRTVYAVADPDIAYVDGEGNVTGLGNGSTVLTATLLPSGRSAEIPVTVRGGAQPGRPDKPEPGPAPAPEKKYYPVSVTEKTENGSVRLSAAEASSGSRVTVTPVPEPGYAVGEVTVVDRGGNALPVTDNGDGTYSFVMPAGGVTVSVRFRPEEKEPAAPVSFADVPEDTWYTEAVAWAATEEITKGTDETHFSPDSPCTRAQTVTFLWRAAGKPEPVGGEMPFTDVEKGSYYEKAVLWAVEQGITKGVSETEFQPGGAVTRAQTVTFLYRFAKAKAEAAAVFTDVPEDAWYAEAVTWAVEKGITNGTGEGSFSPEAPCVRAQIVTFLYRYFHN